MHILWQQTNFNLHTSPPPPCIHGDQVHAVLTVSVVGSRHNYIESYLQ